MTTNYYPRRHYFSSKRIQLTGKEIIKECAEDRKRALETFEYFQDMVNADPSDDKAKSELIKALELSMSANDKKVKLLDLMVKLAMHRDKLKGNAPDEITPDNLSFEDFEGA